MENVLIGGNIIKSSITSSITTKRLGSQPVERLASHALPARCVNGVDRKRSHRWEHRQKFHHDQTAAASTSPTSGFHPWRVHEADGERSHRRKHHQKFHRDQTAAESTIAPHFLPDVSLYNRSSSKENPSKVQPWPRVNKWNTCLRIPCNNDIDGNRSKPCKSKCDNDRLEGKWEWFRALNNG